MEQKTATDTPREAAPQQAPGSSDVWEEARRHERARLARRRNRDKRFRALAVSAVVIAGAFLAFFLVDLVIKGYPALRQAEVYTEIHFSAQMFDDIDQAFPEPVRDLVSRAAKRSIAREVEVADLYLPVHYTEEAAEEPKAAIEPARITEEDMPPWRQDFAPRTIPRGHLLELLGERGLARIQEKVTADPSLVGSVEELWLEGSKRLQRFMRGEGELAEDLRASAALLDNADRVRMRFDTGNYGPDGQKTVERWVLADSAVDQYLKGYELMKPSRYEDPEDAPITPAMADRIEQLREKGIIALHLNHYFFLRGDSKIPEAAGMKSAIIGSVYVVGLVFLTVLPVGVMTSIYLEELAPDNLLTQTIEVNINNLAAVPSILFGVFGLAAFINFFGMPRSSVLVGAAVLVLMTLPIVIIAARAALRAVPQSIRRAGYAMGASRWQVVLHHVLPLSISGIMTGSIIGIAQAMGETAPLLIVGLVSFVPEAPLAPADPTTAMPAQIYSWWSMSLRAFQERAALAILVLLMVLFILNGLAVYIRATSERKW